MRTNLIFWALSFCLLAGNTGFGDEAVPLGIYKDDSRIAANVKATGHRFEAVVTDYEIEIHWDAESAEVTSARLEFDFADVKTGRDRRDREMLEWLDYDSHPVAEFVLESLESQGEQLVARGKLTFHGIEQQIEFPVTIRQFNEAIRIIAETEIDHTDWDLDEIRAFLIMRVDPVLNIEIDIRAGIPRTAARTLRVR